MVRRPCCAKEGVNRGAWTALEDEILTTYITAHGEGNWRQLPHRAGLNRCGKSCRLRWRNYLRPDIKRGNISNDEEQLIIRLHSLLGNRWSLIAGRLPGRTDNEIKNYWNTARRKKTCPLLDSDKNSVGKMKKNKETKTTAIHTKASKCNRAVYPTDQDSSYSMVSSTSENPKFSNSDQDLQACTNSEPNLSKEGLFDHWQAETRDLRSQLDELQEVEFGSTEVSYEADWNSGAWENESGILDLESLAHFLDQI